MTLLEMVLALLALFGHAALWIGAYNRLHQRLHNQGIFHEHAAPRNHHGEE